MVSPHVFRPLSPRSRFLGEVAALASILVLALIPGRAFAAMQIDDIAITSGPAYSAGFFVDFFVDPVVFGTGIASVTISSQSGVLDEVMFEVTPGEFACDRAIPSEPCENFTSLAQISALGDLTFDFLGDLGETDSVTIPLADYDPGTGQVGLPSVISPANGATGVATNVTIQWSTPPAWVQLVSVGLEETLTGISADEAVFFGSPPGSTVTTTTWSPTGVLNNTVYDFEISFFNPFFLDDPRTTDGTLGFFYTSAFESFNEIIFAVPEPGTSTSLAAGLSLLFGLRRRRG